MSGYDLDDDDVVILVCMMTPSLKRCVEDQEYQNMFQHLVDMK